MNQIEATLFVKTLDSSARIFVKDDSVLMKILGFLMFWNPAFMTGFATTVANRVYIPRGWFGRDIRKILVHEVSGHVKQCRMCGLGLHPLVGLPLYTLLYLVLPFPIMGAYFRYRFELGAEVKAWKWMLKNGFFVDDVRKDMEYFSEKVAGSAYGFPWPKPLVLRGFRTALEKVLA